MATVEINSSTTFPYECDTAGNTYQLTENVTANTTAFTVTAANITIDLNGNTLTFGNANNPGITDPKFDNWDDVNTPTNWTIIDGTATRVTSTWPYHTYDAQLSATASIKSGNVTLTANQSYDYFAMINGDSDDSYKIGVYLASDDSELASTTIDTDEIDRGFAMADGTYATNENLYKPTENQSVYLRIDCAGTETKRLAIADIKPSRHYGITHHNYRNTSQYPDLTDAMLGGTCPNLVIKDGTISQGDGYGTKAFAILIQGTNNGGTTIQNLTINMNGRNTGAIRVTPTGNLTIDDVNTNTTSDAQFNRMHAPAGIATSGPSTGAGTIEIKNCTILNDPEIGINSSIGSPATSTAILSIHHNTIRQKEQVTEGYAIAVSNVSSADIYSNWIQPYRGRGIITDTSGTSYSKNLTIRHNTIIDLYEAALFEYAATGLEVVGIRLRNWGDDPLQNVKIYGNTITGSTNADGVHAVYGININAYDPDDDIEIFNNNITVSATGTNYYGVGIGMQILDGSSGGVYSIHDNTISAGSQSYGVLLGGPDPGTGYGDVKTLRLYGNDITAQYDVIRCYSGSATFSDIDIYCNNITSSGTSTYPFYFQGTISDVKISNNNITNSNSGGYEVYVAADESSDITFCSCGTINVNGGGSVGSGEAPCQDGSEGCYASAGIYSFVNLDAGTSGTVGTGAGISIF